jgi:hypothetical protein
MCPSQKRIHGKEREELIEVHSGTLKPRRPFNDRIMIVAFLLPSLVSTYLQAVLEHSGDAVVSQGYCTGTDSQWVCHPQLSLRCVLTAYTSLQTFSHKLRLSI